MRKFIFANLISPQLIDLNILYFLVKNSWVTSIFSPVNLNFNKEQIKGMVPLRVFNEFLHLMIELNTVVSKNKCMF